jgi:hopene-associated glycosyltransferase HpnB
MNQLELGIVLVSLVIWLVLIVGWGRFWQCDQRLEQKPLPPLSSKPLSSYPSICAVIPARNEAEMLPICLRSLLTQDYPGTLNVILVDDQSNDGTAEVARQTADEVNRGDRLFVISGEPLPEGWSGKLWAMEQGVQKAQFLSPDYILLTDADIKHDPANLRRLVTKAEQENLDMASVMVRLRCQSFWEKLLIPAFVFFFMKLYPFLWVNTPTRKTAGAAGGCILIRQQVLQEIGGIERIRGALIDDCALAIAVKQNSRGGVGEVGGVDLSQSSLSSPSPQSPPTPRSGKIWLGLSDRTTSLRPYDTLTTIWNMVARTAYTQLNYNPLLLVGTLAGMVLVYLVPPIALVAGIVTGQATMLLEGMLGCSLMALAYFPTIRFYNCPPLLTVCLPLIAVFYSLMTVDSALRYWQGRGGAWKGRTYRI